ncbi:aminodeoxychorismate synthase component I [Chryseolinea sp. T2]|uniref:aminodeoxychorismate synthase component I n=1 Tax=Chryseolinea sp. T2 TaxID=3129255 RepID=UPI0030773E72
MRIDEFSDRMNSLATARVPFLFMVDFEMQRPEIFPLHEIDPAEILFEVNGRTNAPARTNRAIQSALHPMPLSREAYDSKFRQVYDHLLYGDSYLTNLTVKTEVLISATLRDLFYSSHARYKLLYKDRFLVFSPEIFVQVENNEIRSYPMKGTIDASIPRAAEIIIQDQKELAEHVTIVDLIRNDLSTVAEDVVVERFRYIEKITSLDRELLQVSSSIRGTVASAYFSRPGDLLVALLPAGSVSGAPKKKTMQIIAESEGEPRGYYSGIFGIYDDGKIDSGVMIRFIEEQSGHYYYRSGGGITARSEMQKEYQEVIDKIYVPVS